jgi:hypothetical protein
LTSRIRLFNRAGTLIYEVNAPSFREWVLNDIGNANFTIKARGMEPYVQYGNYVLIENDKLDTWVGTINPPRPWSSRVITVNAKSVMNLFNYRVGSYQQLVQGTWGNVFSQIITVINTAETTLLEIGNYTAGISYTSVVDMSNPYTYLQRALAQAQLRLDFRPVVTNGKLKIYIDMQPTLYTASDLRLEEGLNIKGGVNALLEQGEIYNDVTVLGVSLDQIKFTGRQTDPVSIERYGLRQILFSEGQSQADVDRLAITRLAQYAYPRQTLGLVTLDKGDTFKKLRLGAIAAVELKTQGYYNGGLGWRGDAYIRVIQFNDTNQEGIIVCEEVVNG